MTAFEDGRPDPGRLLLTAIQSAFLLSVVLSAGSVLIPTSWTLGGRFVAAGVGAAIVVSRGWWGRGFDQHWPAVAVAGAAYIALGIASVTWSWAPLLTAAKGALSLLVFLCGAVGGLEFGRRSESDGERLKPWGISGLGWALLTLVTVALEGGFVEGEQGFRGTTDNENMFASVSATIAFPLAEWMRWYRGRAERWVALAAPWTPWVWGALIWLSRSRGGFVLFLVVAIVWWISDGFRRREGWLVGVVGVVVVVSSLVGFGPIANEIDDYAFKKREDRDVLFSRRDVWAETQAAIELAGPMGAGLGVAADQVFRAGEISWLSSVGYGREHGSGWLGVREQLGVAGQAFYAVLGLTLLVATAKTAWLCRRGRVEVSAPLLLGVAMGLYVMSFVEAWNVAPGSPESGFFWTALGQGGGALLASSMRGGERPGEGREGRDDQVAEGRETA